AAFPVRRAGHGTAGRLVQILHVSKRFSEVAMAKGGSPITRAHSTGDWSTQSAVWTSSALFTRCLLVQSVHRQTALPGTGRVSAHRGRASEPSCLFKHPARCSSLGLDVRTIEFLPFLNSFSAAC